MCIISNSRSFCFVHVPKAAGTSITAALSRLSTWCDIELGGTAFGEAVAPAYRKRFKLHKHVPALELKEVIGAQLWRDYFTFAFVRNPYSRAESVFHHLKQWRAWPGSDIMNGFESLQDFVASDFFLHHTGPDNLFRSQSYWTCDAAGSVMVDFIGRFESFEQDLGQVLKRIDPEPSEENAPHSNRSQRKSTDSWTSETRAIIEKRWEADFRVFGYDAGAGADDPNEA